MKRIDKICEKCGGKVWIMDDYESECGVHLEYEGCMLCGNRSEAWISEEQMHPNLAQKLMKEISGVRNEQPDSDGGTD